MGGPLVRRSGLPLGDRRQRIEGLFFQECAYKKNSRGRFGGRKEYGGRGALAED